jgi:hypothetical protein
MVNFVTGWRVHDFDVQANSNRLAVTNIPSSNVAAMGGFNEPPVIAESPFVNIIIDKRKLLAVDKQ